MSIDVFWRIPTHGEPSSHRGRSRFGSQASNLAVETVLARVHRQPSGRSRQIAGAVQQPSRTDNARADFIACREVNNVGEPPRGAHPLFAQRGGRIVVVNQGWLRQPVLYLVPQRNFLPIPEVRRQRVASRRMIDSWNRDTNAPYLGQIHGGFARHRFHHRDDLLNGVLETHLTERLLAPVKDRAATVDHGCGDSGPAEIQTDYEAFGHLALIYTNPASCAETRQNSTVPGLRLGYLPQASPVQPISAM